MKDATKSIVIATDVRFWERATGAHQRIYSMVVYLQQQGHDVTTLLCAPLGSGPQGNERPESIDSVRQAIGHCNLNVISVLDDWKPSGLIQQVVWEIKCIANWLFKSDDGPLDIEREETRRLEDFGSPLLYRRFHEMLQRIQPDVVLAQYVTMAWLVPESNEAGRPEWWVDTHDHLSERTRQFKQFGHRHWLEISESEEAEALTKFDLVIAIQPDEGETFRRSLNDRTPVIVAGHPKPNANENTANAVPSSQPLPHCSLGYFGSDNPSNVDAIEWFLECVWPKVIEKKSDTTLLLAGTICDSFADAGKITGVSLVKQIDDVPRLYESFEIAINPVRFGTGLKIKNQEALAFGKPLVVTRQGAMGMILPTAESTQTAITIADDDQSMSESILHLLTERQSCARARAAASDYANQYLSPTFVYSELIERLNAIKN